MLNIVVLTDLERLPGEVKKLVHGTLERLAFEGKAIVTRIPRSTTAINADLFSNCNAVILRPSDNIKLPSNCFESTPHQVHLFTVGVGRDHLGDFERLDKFNIIDTKPYSNARGVATFNLLLANALLANMPINVNTVDHGSFESTVSEQTNLVGKTWLTIGCGEQVQRLLELGYLSGIDKFYIFNERMDFSHFAECFKYLRPVLGVTLKEDYLALTAEIRLGALGPETEDRTVKFHCINKLEPYCSDADIISVHIPHAPTGSRANTGLIKSEFIDLLRKKPVLINTSRGEIFKEDDVLMALRDGRLRGVAVDVLYKEVESTHDHSRSPLWTTRRSPDGKELNLIITPHVAGSTDNDLRPMWESILRKLRLIADSSSERE